MVYDVITYNGEKELFELRYNILKDVVDKFIVVEFDKTFSGKSKAPSFPFVEWDKVDYRFNTETTYSKYKELAESSPNTQGAEHWKLEFMQKESIKDCLTDLKDDDIVFIGDCDEIWDPKNPFMKGDWEWVPKLKLRTYTYYLNNRSSEEFWGTIVGRWGILNNSCLNHVRSGIEKPVSDKYTGTNEGDRKLGLWGWHFTSLAPYLRQKLEDSYTEESYWTPWVKEHLEENIQNNKDFLGRDFTYKVDESGWPEYLKNHREDYKHLLKP